MNNKKKVFVTAVAVCLIAILSFTTLAWFSDRDEVTNKFQIVDSDMTPDEIFSVDVWEYVDGDTTVKDQDGNIYDKVTPGLTVHKQPYVENTGEYSQWIRVKITINDADVWKKAINTGAISDIRDIIVGIDKDVWSYAETKEENNSFVLVYYLKGILQKDAVVELFNHVQFPAQLTEQEMDYSNGSFEMNILAEAVQADNLPAEITTAKAAFDLVESTQVIQ